MGYDEFIMLNSIFTHKIRYNIVILIDKNLNTMKRATILSLAFLTSSAVFAQAPSDKSQATKPVRYLTIKNFTVDARAQQPATVKDPFEPMNRKIFTFNETLDKYIAKPVAVQYQEKIPVEVRSSYRSFRKNLGEPWNAVNQLIQGKPVRATKTLGRFTVNTLTSLGFADPASRIGLTQQEESFGTTLGYYGVNTGPYLMLPVLGPSTIRDAVGMAIDSQAQPQSYLHNDKATISMTALTGVDKRAGLLSIEQMLPEDKYAAIRDVYLDRKAFAIAELQGKAEEHVFADETDMIEDDVESSDEVLPDESSAPTE